MIPFRNASAADNRKIRGRSVLMTYIATQSTTQLNCKKYLHEQMFYKNNNKANAVNKTSRMKWIKKLSHHVRCCNPVAIYSEITHCKTCWVDQYLHAAILRYLTYSPTFCKKYVNVIYQQSLISSLRVVSATRAGNYVQLTRLTTIEHLCRLTVKLLSKYGSQ